MPQAYQSRSVSPGRSWPARLVPLALFVLTVLAAGQLQHASFGPPPSISPRLSDTPEPGADQDEPRLDLLALNTRPVDEVTTSSVRVLPAGNVLESPVRLVANVLP